MFGASRIEVATAATKAGAMRPITGVPIRDDASLPRIAQNCGLTSRMRPSRWIIRPSNDMLASWRMRYSSRSADSDSRWSISDAARLTIRSASVPTPTVIASIPEPTNAVASPALAPGRTCSAAMPEKCTAQIAAESQPVISSRRRNAQSGSRRASPAAHSAAATSRVAGRNGSTTSNPPGRRIEPIPAWCMRVTAAASSAPPQSQPPRRDPVSSQAAKPARPPNTANTTENIVSPRS